MAEGITRRIQEWPKAVGKYVDERIKIARWAAGQVEDSIRTGEKIILEPGIPPTLSAELGEERRRRVRTARHELLRTSEPFRRFSERRIFQM